MKTLTGVRVVLRLRDRKMFDRSIDPMWLTLAPKFPNTSNVTHDLAACEVHLLEAVCDEPVRCVSAHISIQHHTAAAGWWETNRAHALHSKDCVCAQAAYCSGLIHQPGEYLQPWAEWLHNPDCFWSNDIKHRTLTLPVCNVRIMRASFGLIGAFLFSLSCSGGWEALIFSSSLSSTLGFKCQTCVFLCFGRIKSYIESGSILLLGLVLSWPYFRPCCHDSWPLSSRFFFFFFFYLVWSLWTSFFLFFVFCV